MLMVTQHKFVQKFNETSHFIYEKFPYIERSRIVSSFIGVFVGINKNVDHTLTLAI
jgi:hypothetical protein